MKARSLINIPETTLLITVIVAVVISLWLSLASVQTFLATVSWNG